MRRFSFLLLAAFLCLPLVGCGGDAGDTTKTPPAADGDGGSADKPADGGSDEKKEDAPAE